MKKKQQKKHNLTAKTKYLAVALSKNLLVLPVVLEGGSLLWALITVPDKQINIFLLNSELIVALHYYCKCP